MPTSIPGGGNTQDAARQIFDGLASLLKSSSYVIFAGDLNLTVHYRSSDVPIRDRLVTEFGLVNCTKYIKDKARLCKNEIRTLIPSPTRISPVQNDYIFVSDKKFKINHFDVWKDTLLSDHWPVVADVNLSMIQAGVALREDAGRRPTLVTTPAPR